MARIGGVEARQPMDQNSNLCCMQELAGNRMRQETRNTDGRIGVSKRFLIDETSVDAMQCMLPASAAEFAVWSSRCHQVTMTLGKGNRDH